MVDLDLRRLVGRLISESATGLAVSRGRHAEAETGARNIDHIVNRTILPELAARAFERYGQGGKTYASVNIGFADGRLAYALS